MPLSPRPNIAVDELDRVAGRVADVNRATATIPVDFALDLDPTLAQRVRSSIERPVVNA
jgi:hypothetical protein